MKAFRGWAVTAGLVFAATAANPSLTLPTRARPARRAAELRVLKLRLRHGLLRYIALRSAFAPPG